MIRARVDQVGNDREVVIVVPGREQATAHVVPTAEAVVLRDELTAAIDDLWGRPAVAHTNITDEARALAAATHPADLAQQLLDEQKRWAASVQARDALRADKAALEAELAEVTAQRDAARARVAEFEAIAEVIRKYDGGRLVDECKRFFESLSSRNDLLGALETLLPKHAAPEGQHVEQPELWLVMIQHGSKPGTHHKLAIGPWPSTSRRDVAEAAWKFDPQTIEVQRVEARPVDADEYLEPRLTLAERRAMERRRWLLRGPAVLSFPEDLRR